MSKYGIAILCALAFLAGGAAHLTLNRPAGNAVQAEFAPAKPVEAAPAERPAPVQTAAQAQPAGAEDQSPEEAQSAEAD
ncbi:MAG TPA: hypothetical protein VF586_01825, partial [Pyrinomonadaceae bacterium]